MKKAFFSIVIPTYNRASNLRLALYCILRQNFSDFEIVVSDNCSDDNTKEVVASFKSSKIKYFRNNKNLLIDESQKKAVEHANGKYVFMHADDDLLLYINTLKTVYKEIKKRKCGYMRVNYLCLSLDRKRIFSFGTHTFTNNEYLFPEESNDKILSFIIHSSHCFTTGIVFRNNLPNNVTMLNTDPCPWIDILYYVTKKYGACIIVKPYIVASWSRRQIIKGEEHHLFTLIHGSLKSQNYFNAVKRLLHSSKNSSILHEQIMGIYVIPFPVIKINVGIVKLIKIAIKVCELDPSMKTESIFWINLIISVLTPRIVLVLLRDIFLVVFSLITRPRNSHEIIQRLRQLDECYSGGETFNFL